MYPSKSGPEVSQEDALIGQVNGVLVSFRKLVQDAGIVGAKVNPVGSLEEGKVRCQEICDLYRNVTRKKVALHTKYIQLLGDVAERSEEMLERIAEIQ